MRVSKILSRLIAISLVLAFIASCAPAATPTTAPAAAPTTAPAAAPTTAPPPTQAPAAKKPTLHMVLSNKGHPVVRIMQLGFLEGCKELGYQCKLMGPDLAPADEVVKAAEQAIAEGSGGINYTLYDPAFYPTAEAAAAKGIPVISTHFPIPEGTVKGLKGWISADPAAYGKEAAMAMGKKLGGKGMVAVTQGNFNTTENMAAQSFIKTLKESFPDIKVLAPQEEGFDPPQAIAKAVAILKGNAGITGAFSTTGAGPTTWARAAEEIGKKPGEITIISMDYSRENLDLVKADKVYALVAQPLYQEMYQAVIMLDKIIKGEKVPYENLMPAPLIYKADLDQYYAMLDRVEATLGKK